jgi:dynein heavy chain
MWVRAMVTYDRVAKNIEPKKEKLAGAEAQLAKVNEQLNVKKTALQVRLCAGFGAEEGLRRMG